MTEPKTVVIGGGIIGLSCAYALCKDGHNVVVIDRDFDGDKTSFGNAGGIAVTDCMPVSHPGVIGKVPKWLLDPLGPLSIRPTYAPRLVPWLWRFYRSGRASVYRQYADALAALNSVTYQHLRLMLADLGLESDLEETGALVLYKDRRAFAADEFEWTVKRDRGVRFEVLNRDQLIDLEPAIGERKTVGVFQPDWSLIKDPKKLVAYLRRWLCDHGTELVTDHVSALLTDNSRIVGVKLASGGLIGATNVVVACGAWSEVFAQQAGDKVLLESERGYNTTIDDPDVKVSRTLVFAEEKFVVSPLTVGLRIGGAAEFAGLTGPPNYARAKALFKLAQQHLPGLTVGNNTEWMGHRSSTPDSVPVIGPSPRAPGLYYAFGHGHLGLTHAAITGSLIADSVSGRSSSLSLEPYAIERFSN